MSGSKKPAGTLHEIPTELSKELHDKFDVKEMAELQIGEKKKEPEIYSNKRVRKKIKNKNKDEEQRKISSVPFAYPDRRAKNDSIWIAEQLTYTISYIGIAAGEVVVDVLPFQVMGGRKVYHIRGHALSTAVFSLVYRLNDTIETFMDYEGDFSHRFHLVFDETKQQRDSLELFDAEKKETFYWSRWEYPDHSKREIKETAPIQPFSQDILSSLFYLRTIPLEPNSIISFPFVSEGKESEAICTVLRRETVNSPLGKVKAVVVRPELKYQGVIKKVGESSLWITDDERRFPLRMEVKARIGTVAAQLTHVELGSAPSRTNASVQ